MAVVATCIMGDPWAWRAWSHSSWLWSAEPCPSRTVSWQGTCSPQPRTCAPLDMAGGITVTGTPATVVGGVATMLPLRCWFLLALCARWLGLGLLLVRDSWSPRVQGRQLLPEFLPLAAVRDPANSDLATGFSFRQSNRACAPFDLLPAVLERAAHGHRCLCGDEKGAAEARLRGLESTPLRSPPLKRRYRRPKASLRRRPACPVDPGECQCGTPLNCVHLAKTAESAEARDRFAHLARTRLAEELERIQAVLAKDGDETEPKRRAQK